MREVVASACRGVAWLATGGDGSLDATPRALVVGGHSAGGHLAVMAARHLDDRRSAGRTGAPFVGCAVLSGLFDLAPLLRTSVATRAGLTEADADTLSPMRLSIPPGWLIAGVGERDGAGFVAQADDYATRRLAAGASTERFVVPGASHYSVLLDLVGPDSRLAERVRSRLAEASRTLAG